jgi:DUF4097 and DUF4098 domain-containing protein YvlB
MPRTFLVTAIAALSLVAAGSAQTQTRTRTAGGCADHHSGSSDRASFCEERDDTIGGANPITVDTKNGGISVRGWDRGDVHVHARIQTQGATDADARRIASAVHVETMGGQVKAEGPQTGDGEGWSVSFDLDVPRSAMLTLNSTNGGISITDFRGSASFSTRNGGVTLTGVNGELKGSTTNGGVTIDLSGDHWDGAGLDVSTRNGGIKMSLPKNYSAELETGTSHGRINVDFPITVSGRIESHLATTLGSGGPKLKAMTTNGGVVIREKQ